MVMIMKHLIILLAIAINDMIIISHASSPFINYDHLHSGASFVPSTSLSAQHYNRRRQDCRLCNNKQQHIPLRRTIYHASPQEEDDEDSKVLSNRNIINNNVKDDNKFGLGQSSFAKYGRPQDIDEDSFGALLPIAEAVDEATGGWGLSYADLHPVTPRTTVGQAFLATNFFYAAAGIWLGINGDWFYGGLTELAGVVSFIYHYTQLEFGKNRAEVRLALLIDYFCAGAALITGGVYMISAGITSIPLEALVAAGGAGVCLSLCWVWEFGYPYIFWHSLWHILSAYTGYLVGEVHLSTISA